MHTVVILILVLTRIFFAVRGGQSLSFEARPDVISLLFKVALVSTAFVIVVDHGSPFTAGALLCLAFSGIVTRALLVPAGIPHVSYWFTRAGHFGMARSDAAFNELRARLTWGLMAEPSRFGTRFRNLFHAGSDRTIRGSALGARAILDALSGDAAAARELFDVAQSLPFGKASRSVKAYCQAWLLADAARRGAYHEVVRLAQRGPLTRRRLFMKGAALCMLGASQAPRPLTLWILWALAPDRLYTRSLLRSALAAKKRPEIVVAERGMAGARRATLSLLRLPRGAASRAELRHLARAWQDVFESGEVRQAVALRKEQLQASFDVTAVAARFEADIVQLFATLLRDTLPEKQCDQPDADVLIAAKDQIQFELLGEIESLCVAMPHGNAEATFAYEEHWRAWARVRALAQQFFDALPERKGLVFDAVGTVLLNHGAWLYNKERARVLSHDIFRWLYALCPRDWIDFKTLKRNVRLASMA